MTKAENKHRSHSHHIELWGEDEWVLQWTWKTLGTWRTANRVTDDHETVERFAKKWNLEVPEHED